ncbi:hypothetical protein FOL47_007198, partial [Perkinsus chesapeaki]
EQSTGAVQPPLQGTPALIPRQDPMAVFEAFVSQRGRVYTAGEESQHLENYKKELMKRPNSVSLVELQDIFDESRPAIMQSVVDEINSKQNTWKASIEQGRLKVIFRRFHTGCSPPSVSVPPRLCGTLTNATQVVLGEVYSTVKTVPDDLPSTFDARLHFGECKDIIGHIRDQSECGSCWAVAPTSAFNDRLCIATKGAFQQLLSAGHMLACCRPPDSRYLYVAPNCDVVENCTWYKPEVSLTGVPEVRGAIRTLFICAGGFVVEAFCFHLHRRSDILRRQSFRSFGCTSGSQVSAWFFLRKGVVSGGDYAAKDEMTKADGCWPYNFPKCAHDIISHKYPPCTKNVPETPDCVDSCPNQKYTTSFDNDLHRTSAYPRSFQDPPSIKSEIMANGPVSASMKVYEDFLTYKSGVYSHMTGAELGSHGVKIIGWGNEGGEDFWLVVNSWNEEWGEHGLFKIKIGDSGIEEAVLGAKIQE